MKWLRKHKFVTALVCVAVVSSLMLWFMSWLKHQGETEVSIVANWTIKLANARIDQSAKILNDLAKSGVQSCGTAQQEKLREAAFGIDGVKALSVVAAGGETICSSGGIEPQPRDIVASASTSDPAIMLDAVQIGDASERWLRVRRISERGSPSLAALIPVNLLLPQVAPKGGLFNGYARLTLADGTLLGEIYDPDEPRNSVTSPFMARAQSLKYGPIVTVEMAQDGVIAGYDDLRRIGVAVTAMVACLILISALLIQPGGDAISELERALLAGEFVPYYQPMIDIRTGKLLGSEVLVRWRKSDGTIVPPGAFIHLVESNGLIIEFTRSLMRQVCKDIGPAMAARPHLYVSFNAAPRHFEDSVILNDVGSIFEGSQIRLAQVVIEVTERSEIENLTAARRVVAALQSLGCRVAIDDVGTGHSGLSYILKLGVDIIKIDKLFVESLQTEHQSRAIVKTLVDLAANLRMKIVAEGVENFEVVNYLRELGINAVQGYVFAPPLPGSAFLRLMEAVAPEAPADAGQAAEGERQPQPDGRAAA